MWTYYVIAYGSAVVIGWAVAKVLIWSVERGVNHA